MIITCDCFNGVFELSKNHSHMLATATSPYCFKGWIYRRKCSCCCPFHCSKLSLHGVNVPWILNSQQPLNAVTTTTTMSACVLNVYWMFPLVELFLPMHALQCVSSHWSPQTSLVHAVSFRLRMLKPKYATFLLEMLALSPPPPVGQVIAPVPLPEVNSICKGAECEGGQGRPENWDWFYASCLFIWMWRSCIL